MNSLLVTGLALCGRPGAALLNFGAPPSESRETYRCHRTALDLRVCDPKDCFLALRDHPYAERHKLVYQASIGRSIQRSSWRVGRISSAQVSGSVSQPRRRFGAYRRYRREFVSTRRPGI